MHCIMFPPDHSRSPRSPTLRHFQTLRSLFDSSSPSDPVSSSFSLSDSSSVTGSSSLSGSSSVSDQFLALHHFPALHQLLDLHDHFLILHQFLTHHPKKQSHMYVRNSIALVAPTIVPLQQQLTSTATATRQQTRNKKFGLSARYCIQHPQQWAAIADFRLHFAMLMIKVTMKMD